MMPARLQGRTRGATEADTAAEAWCARVNTRVHSAIATVPAERLTQEVALLLSLPSLRLRVEPDPVTRKVDRIEHACGSPLAADSECRTPGEVWIQDAHYDGPRPAPGRALGPEPRPHRFCGLGPVAEASWSEPLRGTPASPRNWPSCWN